MFAFRYSVYGKEIGYKGVNADHGRRRARDEEDDKPYTTLVYTVDDGGRLSGACRLRQWGPGEVPPGDWKTFSMARFDGIGEFGISELGRLAIEPTHRGGVVPPRLYVRSIN